MIWVYAFVPSWAENWVFLNKTGLCGDEEKGKREKKASVVKQGGRQ